MGGAALITTTPSSLGRSACGQGPAISPSSTGWGESGPQGPNRTPLSSVVGPTANPALTPCPPLPPPRPPPCVSLTTSATGHGQTADKRGPCTLLLRPDRPGRGSEGEQTMTSTHPRVGQRHRPGRSPRNADPCRAPRRGLPGRPLRRVLGNPLWCPAPAAEGKPLVRAGDGAKAAPSQPSSLLLLSVVEEIIGFRGARTPSPAGRGHRQPQPWRSAADQSRATREREQG